ncbi:MAG: hypothetical protein DRP63_07425 [Planctomycetota bacterium]|nr:MAG: hypothetical protein DRP63_07425 [Planctomycetota bacterium]
MWRWLVVVVILGVAVGCGKWKVSGGGGGGLPNTLYVNATSGNDAYDGTSPNRAKKTIQAALDAAKDGYTIIVADGLYFGLGNTNLLFTGKAVHLRSQNGPANCIIDCMMRGTRAFYFNFNETQNTIVEGFTIRGLPSRSVVTPLISSPEKGVSFRKQKKLRLSLDAEETAD